MVTTEKYFKPDYVVMEKLIKIVLKQYNYFNFAITDERVQEVFNKNKFKNHL